MCDLRSYIYTKKPGDDVVLNVLRNNKEQQISVILGKKWEMGTVPISQNIDKKYKNIEKR